MSGSPRCWGAAWEDRARRAASRGRRPSRLLRSRCCWSPDRWGSTAQRARPGPGTPVREGAGGQSGGPPSKATNPKPRGKDDQVFPSNLSHAETTAELWVNVCVSGSCVGRLTSVEVIDSTRS